MHILPLLALLAKLADPPETVVVTYRPLPGKEAALAQLLHEQHATLTRLGLEAPGTCHVAYRDGANFVEVFTWKSHETPDDAPDEILAIWKQLNAITAPKNGIEFHEVDPVP